MKNPALGVPSAYALFQLSLELKFPVIDYSTLSTYSDCANSLEKNLYSCGGLVGSSSFTLIKSIPTLRNNDLRST